MNIQKGMMYQNRTFKYLYVGVVKTCSQRLFTELNYFRKLSVGVGDSNVKTEQPCLFILIETEPSTEVYKERFSTFLDWLRNEDYYEHDYVYEDLSNADKHMIVLKIPNLDCYNNFMLSRYSEMYTKEEVEDLFLFVRVPTNKMFEKERNNQIKIMKKVLLKDPTYLNVFVDKVNEDFRTRAATAKDFKDAELDYPLNLVEEIFNYKK